MGHDVSEQGVNARYEQWGWGAASRWRYAGAVLLLDEPRRRTTARWTRPSCGTLESIKRDISGVKKTDTDRDMPEMNVEAGERRVASARTTQRRRRRTTARWTPAPYYCLMNPTELWNAGVDQEGHLWSKKDGYSQRHAGDEWGSRGEASRFSPYYSTLISES